MYLEPKQHSTEVAHVYDQRYATHAPEPWAVSDVAEANALVALVDRLRNRLARPKPARPKCLDIGCAAGCISAALARAGYQTTGIDFSRVAINKAQANASAACSFLHMDAFKPQFDVGFDLVFCRGFSGYNTHNAAAVIEFVNTYMRILNPNGVFALCYASDFTGKEVGNDTANWTHSLLEEIMDGVEADAALGPVYYFGRRRRYLKAMLTALKFLLKKKHYFCVMFAAKGGKDE